MNITKDKLQTICKILSLPPNGTKPILQHRICDNLCAKNKTPPPPSTLRGLIRTKNILAVTIAKDIQEMIDDDSEIPTIIRTLVKLHKVTINKIDINVFVELLDAANKRDYAYIEEKVEEWGKKCKYGLDLLKLYKPNDKELQKV